MERKLISTQKEDRIFFKVNDGILETKITKITTKNGMFQSIVGLAQHTNEGKQAPKRKKRKGEDSPQPGEGAKKGNPPQWEYKIVVFVEAEREIIVTR